MRTESLAEELAELTQGAAEVLPAGGLEARLKERAGKPLRVKLGFDPTKPDLHLGHAVVLHALKRFQDHGHQVVVIIGDFTARIGDPTGKEATRPALSTDEVAANARTYLEQLGRILDLSRTEIRYNDSWLGPMTLADSIKLMAQATVAQMLARENFAKRYERNDPIAMHEFLYPLLQGWDSVVVEADVEMGGTDQKFNNLMGRELQHAHGQKPQIVMLYPILEGTDGVQKMSKSLGNTIGLSDDPRNMYGKVMQIPDTLMPSYYRLASCLPLAELTQVVAELSAGTANPRDAKMRLARAIVARYHGADEARNAEEGFVRQFQQKKLPDEIPVVALAAEQMPLANLLVAAQLAVSSSEARRLVTQGGVKRHGDEGVETFKDPLAPITLTADGFILQVGKLRYARIVRAQDGR